MNRKSRSRLRYTFGRPARGTVYVTVTSPAMFLIELPVTGSRSDRLGSVKGLLVLHCAFIA